MEALNEKEHALVETARKVGDRPSRSSLRSRVGRGLAIGLFIIGLLIILGSFTSTFKNELPQTMRLIGLLFLMWGITMLQLADMSAQVDRYRVLVLKLSGP